MCFESQKYKQYYALVIMVLLSPANSHLYAVYNKEQQNAIPIHINVSIKWMTRYFKIYDMVYYN